MTSGEEPSGGAAPATLGPTRRRRALLIAICIVAAIALVTTGYRCSSESEARAAEARVRAVASIGMDRAELVQALESAGFGIAQQLASAEHPGHQDLYVPIRGSIGFLESMEYAVTGTTRWFGRKAYVVIRLSPEGNVVAIE